jgi:type IV pilus assembly protein PilV
MSGNRAPIRPARRPRPGAGLRRRARGVALVEALIAILLFSLGILGVVATQARSVQMLSEATLRSQAAQHATDLIAEMWLTDPAQREALYASASASPVRYQAWKLRLESGSRALPGAADAPPQVVVNTIQTPYSSLSVGSQTVSAVTVTIFWTPPGAGTTNSYTTTAMILEPQS